MKKLFKLLGFLISAVFVLLIMLVVALTIFIDPNDYKDEIAVLVKEQTGRTLSIEGDLELSFFPWIGVEIGKVQLANAPGFG
ncbi:MAG: AsmA family protein, partial [Calditrichia bacterium]|nr:AsmA family protein [Calditrichia bacterium]